MRALLLILALLVSGVAQADDFYRWTDERGNPHFSDSYYEVPEQYRDQVREPESFEDGAGVSVVGGLDSRWIKNDPNSKSAAASPSGSAELAERFKQLEAGNWAALGAGMLAFMATFVLVALGIGLLIGSWMLRLACRWCTEDEPGWLKAAGVVLVQSVAASVANMTLVTAIGTAVGPSLTFVALGMLTGFAVNVSVLRAMQCETVVDAIKVQLTIIGIGICLGLVLGGLALGAGIMTGVMAR